MSVLVGLRLADEDLDMVADWLQRCHNHHDFPLQRPIHRDHILIPLLYSGGEKMDCFQPLGTIDRVIEFKHSSVCWVGQRNTVVLRFTDEWVLDRIEQLSKAGFKRRGKKSFCRLPMSIHSSFLDARTYHRLLPKKSVRVIEEVVIPFDVRFGAYAHYPKEKQT